MSESGAMRHGDIERRPRVKVSVEYTDGGRQDILINVTAEDLVQIARQGIGCDVSVPGADYANTGEMDKMRVAVRCIG